MARRELVASCALIGALGGALFGFGFADSGSYRHWPWGLVGGLAIATAISATLLGLFLARRRGEPTEVGFRAAWASFVAGALNGVLMLVGVAVFTGRPHGIDSLVAIPIAGGLGAMCAIPFAPAIIVAAVSAAYADARHGSIAHRSQARRVLRNALLCLAAASVVLTPKPNAPLAVHLPAYVMALAVVVLLALATLEVLERRRIDATTECEPAPEGVHADRVVDYGVGHAMFMRRAHGETYRAQASVIELRHGNAHAALALLGASLRGHAFAAATIAVALTITLAC